MREVLPANPQARPANGPRKLTILGATGSIGQSAADVLRDAPGLFVVEAVAGGRDGAGLARMARRLGARFAAVADPAAYSDLKAGLAGSGVEAAAGPEAVVAAAVRPVDLVLGAIAGTAGLAPTFAAVERGQAVALANKECLVCAGAAFMKRARETGATILPVDSEHNAIFQALGGADPRSIEKMTLTASGGPFRTWSREAIAAARPEQALAHPNWAMGRKVTIDSAGLMNKGLELIEAHHLFGAPSEKLDVLVHPQSIVHGLVSFADGSVTAGLACPDMKTPIAHCLAWPERAPTTVKRLDLAAVGSLTFERPDFARFPALRLAMDALAGGQGLATVLNAANEVAVEAYLAERISFYDIAKLVEEACDRALADGVAREPESVAEALEIHHIVQERLTAILERTNFFGMVTT
jgi:1-deoxy-D-xylulose-5-phosphate reductoisomerase